MDELCVEAFCLGSSEGTYYKPGPYPEKNFGGGFSDRGAEDESPQAPRTSRRRRRDRDAEGIEGVGNGEGVSPSPAD